MIYFDNGATTPLCESAKAAVCERMEHFANPSSAHRAGFLAHQLLEEDRRKVAKSLSCSPEEILFTSGGTESNNTALFSIARTLRRRGKTFVTTDSEHPSVEECLKELEQQGFRVIRLSTKGGRLDREEVIKAASCRDVIGASLMHTNNETGAVYPVAEAARLLREQNPHILIHCDCVQAYGKTPLSFSLLNADLLSVSAHKLHGPKGVGALALRKKTRLLPLLLGGGQEGGLRSGTENTLSLAGFAAAAEEAQQGLAAHGERVEQIKGCLCRLLSEETRIRFNTPEKASPYVLSLQVEGFRSEVLLRILSEREIYVSAGSACSAKVGKSPVLKAFGLTDREADCTLRLSFSSQNTVEEAQEFAKNLKSLLR